MASGSVRKLRNGSVLAKKSSGAYQRRVAYTINRQTGEIRRQPKEVM